MQDTRPTGGLLGDLAPPQAGRLPREAQELLCCLPREDQELLSQLAEGVSMARSPGDSCGANPWPETLESLCGGDGGSSSPAAVDREAAAATPPLTPRERICRGPPATPKQRHWEEEMQRSERSFPTTPDRRPLAADEVTAEDATPPRLSPPRGLKPPRRQQHFRRGEQRDEHERQPLLDKHLQCPWPSSSTQQHRDLGLEHGKIDEQRRRSENRCPPATPERQPQPPLVEEEDLKVEVDVVTPPLPRPGGSLQRHPQVTSLTPKQRSEVPAFFTPKQRLEGSFPFSTPTGRPPADQAVGTTPPPGPKPQQKRLRSEIEEALFLRSRPLLSLALLQNSQCGASDPVYEAVRHGHVEALELLLSCGAEPDECCRGRRPLTLAIQNCMSRGDAGHRAAELLLQHGARPEGQHDVGPPLLHDAAARACAVAAELLLEGGADPNELDSNGFSALHMVCKGTLALRIACEAPTGWWTASARRISEEERTVRLLLRHGADPLQPDAWGATAAQRASRHNIRLQDLLSRAEKLQRRRSLSIVLAQHQQHRQKVCEESQAAEKPRTALAESLGQLDISGLITRCL